MSNENFDISEAAIKCKIIDHQDLKAIVTVDFKNFVVRGFCIRTSKFATEGDPKSEKESLWVVPPTYKDSSGKYHPTFFIPNKELWEALKDYILEEFHRQSLTLEKKRYDMEETDIVF